MAHFQLNLPYIFQESAAARKFGQDCGAACGLMILQAYGKGQSVTLDQFYTMTEHTIDDGLTLFQVKSILERAEYAVSTEFHKNLIINDIIRFLNEGKAMIVRV